ncbi:MAG: hypothetical protein H5U40_17405, partial [Polyangiaceae bacterium]|nr:hypothetical protein [Polyangiaceae bacterium]
MTLLKAGGAAFFSAACITALNEAGFEMGEFGSYDSVLKYLQECRLRRMRDEFPVQYAALSPRQRLSKAADRPVASRREWQLGEPTRLPENGNPNSGAMNPLAFQSGHTVQNATQQTMRGHECSNVVTGHSDGGFPCQAHQGMATDPRSIHGQGSMEEFDDATRGGQVPARDASGNPVNYAGLEPPESARQCQTDAEGRAVNVLERTRETSQAHGKNQDQATRHNPSTPAGTSPVSTLPGTSGGTAQNGLVDADEG